LSSVSDLATWPESPSGGILGDGLHAHATERPTSVDSLREIVKAHVAQCLAIYPQGGRTALDYGGIPARPGIAIDTSALNKVVDYPAADMTITIEAGMTLASLRSILEAENQRLLVDAPNPERATLGGIYATNTCGSRRHGGGRPRDQIIGVSFVTSPGEIVKGGGRVVKNVAGYDFPKLITGSMGTLGIITQMTLKVRPVPEASAIAWCGFDSNADLAAAIDYLNTSSTRPMAVDLLNGPAAQTIGGPFGLPADRPTLVVGIEDNTQSVAWQLDQLKQELARAEVSVIESEASNPVWDALNGFSAIEAGAISFRANLRPSSVAAFVAELDPGRWSVQAHAGSGIVWAHALDDWTVETAQKAIEPLRRRAVAESGNLTLPRCPTAWKNALGVWGHPQPDWPLGERVRAALDPHKALNPGRFIATMKLK
jgi:glycolate oxidase FAD binding subunit